MKIALVTDGIYPYVLGGMQKHSYYLAKYFAKFGHQITVYHPIPNGVANYTQDFTEEELKQLNFEEVPFPKSDGLPGHYIRCSKQYADLIWEKVKSEPFDFIYTKGFTGRTLLENKAKLRCPVGVQLHGLEMFQEGGNVKQWMDKALLKPIAKKCLQNADVVFSYGGKIRELTKRLKVSNIITQHGCANDFWLRPVNQAKSFDNSILFVGRYEHRKGHHLINDVIPKLNEEFNLKMVGDVPKQKQIENPNIQYIGNKTAEEVFELAQESTFLLTPSLAEGFPTIIVEAMAQGVIPIATNVGAVEEIVNEENGVLFEPHSADELENAIQKALSLPIDQRKQCSNAARVQVEEHFNWENSAAKLLSQIEKFCDSWKRTHSSNH